MKVAKGMALAASLCLAGMSLAVSAAEAKGGSNSIFAPATQGFTAKYKGGTHRCTTNYHIEGVEPADGAKHPVFLYMVGTTEHYKNASAMAAVNGMAARGYVAATVQYPDFLFGSCDAIERRTQCIFDSSSSESAITAVCSRPGADCDNKGLVVGGFSQGSLVATLAKNYDSRVAAAWGMGTGWKYSVYNLSSCMTAGLHALPDDHLRIADGVDDEFLSKTTGGSVIQAQTVTGLTACDPSQVSCYRSNGSGYHIVQDSEVGAGRADHCYMRVNGCSSYQDNLNPVWQDGTADWNLNTELDWLYNFTSH